MTLGARPRGAGKGGEALGVGGGGGVLWGSRGKGVDGNGVRVGFDDMTGYIPMANVHGDRKMQRAEHFKINVPW